MSEKSYKKIMVSMMVLLSFYIFATILKRYNEQLLISSILTLMASYIFLRNVLNKKGNNSLSKIVWLCLSFSCLLWSFSDALLLYYFINNINSDNSIIITFIFSAINISLLTGCCIFCASVIKKWDYLQLFFDAYTIISITMFFLGTLFKNIEFVTLLELGGIVCKLSFLADLLIVTCIIITYSSIRVRKLPLYIKLISVSAIIYVIYDLYKGYLLMSGNYSLHPATEPVYMASLVLICIGVYYKNFSDISFYTDSEQYLCTNIGEQRNNYLLLIYPLILIIFNSNTFVFMLHFLLLIILRNILSLKMSTGIEKDIMLSTERELNQILEKKVHDRTLEIVQKNKELEQINLELNYLSNQDTITTLYNRRFFINDLDSRLKKNDKLQKTAIFFIDLDRFKTINDIYGHQIGDRVLVQIANRLGTLSNENCTVARMGGDEFVISHTGNFDYKYVENFADRMISMCCEAIEIGPYEFHVSASVGISIYPLDSDNTNTLMRYADIAMYQAKAQGKSKFVLFNSEFSDILSRKNEIEIQLKKADFDNEFEVYYQPQFSIPDKKLIGAEALLRWKNQQLGYVSPAEFVPIAEEVEYINAIGEWVMDKVTKQISVWDLNSYSNIKIGINVSPKQLDNKSLIHKLTNAIENNLIAPEHIDIEITESIAIEGEFRIKQIESLFSKLGVSISIDDFGTGYSSLSYLKIFPFERIKIAKPLIDALSFDSYDLHIVKSIIDLSKAIGIRTIAEGVERQEQLDLLIDLGCDEIQGYLMEKPIPAEMFEKKYLSCCRYSKAI